MGTLEGDQILMRIFIGEADRYEGKAAYEEILQMLKREKIAGATVLRGIAGFGAKSHMHKASLLRLSQDLPIVIETVDTQENIERVMTQDGTSLSPSVKLDEV